MKSIWNYVHAKPWDEARKTHCFLFLNALLFAAVGLGVWFALHFFVLNTISWAICFTSYPGFFIGVLGGVLYLYRFPI